MRPIPGTYVLILAATDTRCLRVGQLGNLILRRGWYVYVGSAFGSGGLRARLAHHRKPAPRPHWHIDYLRLHAELRRIWYTYDPARREHEWAYLLQRLAGVEVPMPGFGSSDCRCRSHLLRFGRQPLFRAFQREIRTLFPGHAPISSIITA